MITPTTEAPVPSETVPSESSDRLVGPDVVRACALIGVVVMNYHGYLIIRGARPGGGAAAEFFDPFTGPLSTRFAATFVLTAGVAVTLLTRGTVARAIDDSSNRHEVTEMRWRLVRRGLVLYLLGQVLDVVWPGTIILYYGAMFIVAALLFTLRSGVVIAVGFGAALAGWGINVWAFQRSLDGGSTRWLRDPGEDSIRRFVFDIAVNGTHPLLPWLAFFCVGIVVGRLLGRPQLSITLVGIGLILVAGAGLIESRASTPIQQVAVSTGPFDRSIVYVASALGTALVAFAVIGSTARWSADRYPQLIDPLRRAGQMTLTIYIAHILAFNLIVDWLGWIEPAGLGTALGFALGFWAVAIALAATWHARFGRGPAERLYRHLGG